jgi:protein-tyrosine-phosphatase
MKSQQSVKVAILFLSSMHQVRSRIASTWLNLLYPSYTTALSAGVTPNPFSPLAGRVMAEAGIAIDSVAPRTVVRALRQLPKFEYVIDLSDEAEALALPNSAAVVHRQRWPVPALASEAASADDTLNSIRMVRDALLSMILQWADANGWRERDDLPVVVRHMVAEQRSQLKAARVAAENAARAALPKAAPQPKESPQPSLKKPAPAVIPEARKDVAAPVSSAHRIVPVVRTEVRPVSSGENGTTVLECVMTNNSNEVKKAVGSSDPDLRAQFLGFLRFKSRQISQGLPIGAFSRMEAYTVREVIVAEARRFDGIFVRSSNRDMDPEMVLNDAKQENRSGTN